jgi:hypothetical protein
MKNMIAGACAGWLLAGVAVIAHAPGSTQAPGQSAPLSNRAETSLTVIGCLKHWDGSIDPKTTKSRPAQSGPSAKYMLSNIESRNQGGGVPVLSYALTGDSAVNLAGHVNHKMQVTGDVAADSQGHPSGASSTETTAATSADRKRAAPLSLPTMQVTSVTMLSDTCP